MTEQLKTAVYDLARYDRQSARIEWDEDGVTITEIPHMGDPISYTLYGTAGEVLGQMIDSEQARTANAEVGPWSVEEVEALRKEIADG